MNTKAEIITLLEEHRNSYTSGQLIADHLHISRAAVWKMMQQLQKEGYQIEAISRKGYRLHKESDALSVQGIRYYLPKPYQESPIEVLPVTDSTNKQLKQRTLQGATHHTILVANEQTHGVGRFEKSFYSPKDTGIYMSVLIRDHRPLQDATMVTVMSGVAVCRVLARHSKHSPQIKWINDIYLNGKKVCGILSEAIIDFESGMSEAMIIGIGINVTTSLEDFPEELQSIATSCGEVDGSRNELIAEVASELFHLYELDDRQTLLEEYRKASYVLHKHITFTYQKELCSGYVLDINEVGHLIIETKQGIVELHSGEVKEVRLREA